MNGSRPTPPRPGTQTGGDRSSLDALNRTIEGLEARIEGLMGSAGREPRGRSEDTQASVQTVERPQARRLDPVSEILQRQRALSSVREEDPARDRLRQARDYGPAQTVSDDRRAPQPVARDLPFPQTRAESLQPRLEKLRSEQYRSTYIRPEQQASRATGAGETYAAADLRATADLSRSNTAPAEPAMAEIAKALVGLRQELKQDIADGLSREMTALRAEIRGISHEAAQDQTAALDIRDDLQRLSDSIGQLGRQASPGQADELRVEFDELRAMIDGLAREDSVRRMEDRWSGVETRLTAFDTNRDDELLALAYRLDEIKSHIGQMDSGPALHALEDKLVSVAQAIEMIGRHMQQPDDRQLTSQFADIDARLDEISRAIVASGRTSAASDTAGVTRVEGRLADLSRQIDTLSKKPQDVAGVNRVEGRLADLSRQIDTLSAKPAETGLAARIEALAARVEELSTEEAATRLEERLDQLSAMMERSQKASAQPDLTSYLNDISRKIDALDQGSVNDALGERLDELARRIDTLDMPAAHAFAGDERFNRLENQLTGIAERLIETQAAPHDDTDILRSLQDQIANLSSLVSQPRDMAVSEVPAQFEDRMSALEDYLATSDEYIIEAARQAAEAVMEAYARKGPATTPANSVDMAAISALADDLKVLEDLSRSGEERTARTFDTLHETLVHIVDKLERLEERGVRQDETRASEKRQPPAEAPRMPKARQPMFGTDDDPFDGIELDTRFDMVERELKAGPIPTQTPPLAYVAAPSRAEVAAAVERIAPKTPVETVAEEPVATMPAKGGLLSGLTRRFKTSRAPEPVDAKRLGVAPSPSVDPRETMAPDVANQLLEPGSGVPDVKKILERVRASQNSRAASPAGADGEKSDFIAAARRAAQLAAEEVDTINRNTGRAAPAKTGGALSRHRRPIMMAVGAVLLAIMSYPMVSTLLRGHDEPVATLEQPVSGDMAQSSSAESSAPSSVVGTDPQPASNTASDMNASNPQVSDTQAKADTPQQLEPMPVENQPVANQPAEAMQADPASAAATPAQDQAAAPAEDAKPADVDTAAAAPNAADAQAATDGAVATTETPAAPAVTLDGLTVPAEAAPALAEAVGKGDPMAVFEIGAMYTEGRGLRADFAKAAQWYERAAAGGIVPAQYRLASLYEKGSGVPRDLKKAKALYLSAAEKGNISAMHNLAVMLANGSDGAPDYGQAAIWFTKAADLGVRDSQFNLAILYARGNGVKQDLEESYKWFAAAARDGDTDAAQKRDEVAKVLTPEQLDSAKAKFDAWKVIPSDDKANNTDVPDTWLGKGVKTSSVDMKKALRNIQAILNNNGFDAGKADGEMGAKTVAAIKAFQKKIGQEPTGQITDALVKELLKRNG